MQFGSRHRFAVLPSVVAASLALVPLPVLAEVTVRAASAHLHLVFVDLSGTASSLLLGTLEEVHTLLRPVGVQVTGEVALAGDQRASGGASVVLLPYDPSRSRTQPTGGVAPQAYERQLTVWAFPPRVAAVLGLDLSQFGRWSNRHRQEFHRALAVVVVHELAHALAGATHRPTGLMSPQLRRVRLLDPKLAVYPDLHAAFRNGVSRINAVDSKAPGAPVASSPPMLLPPD